MPDNPRHNPESDDGSLLRCFVAVDVPEQLKAKILALSSRLESYGVKIVERPNLHLTVKFLGNVHQNKLAMVEDRLRTIDFSKFTVRLRSIGVFPNEHFIKVIWVGGESDELYTLAKKINSVLFPDFKKEEFTAHLTIARVKRTISKSDLHRFLEQHKNDNFGDFVCSSFELKQSKLAQTGPEYRTLAAFEAKS